MELIIKGKPEEIKKVLHTMGSSEEYEKIKNELNLKVNASQFSLLADQVTQTLRKLGYSPR